jgi:hypothetical protein
MTTTFLPNVGQFAYVWADQVRTFKIPGTRKVRKFRIFGYCAYNAGGAFMPESNGIAIVSEKRGDKHVITDEIAKASSYLEPTSAQRAEFDRLTKCSENEFKAACLSGRSRYA